MAILNVKNTLEPSDNPPEDLPQVTPPKPVTDTMAPVTQPAESTGLVNTAAAQAPAPAAPAQTTTNDLSVKPETVENRLNDLTASGSRYVEQARSDAQRNANSRGLINSTMAGEAGVEAAIRSALPIASQDATNLNRFLENRQSTDLNKEMAILDDQLQQGRMNLDADLRKDLELTLNDARFSDEVKLQYVNQINNIMRDTAAQIAEIGMSDRSAEAQAAAIRRIELNRNAEIKVYQDLLGSFPDWDWGTDFSSGLNVTAAPPTSNLSSSSGSSSNNTRSNNDFTAPSWAQPGGK